ncbi:hypothetical protein HMPREF1510_1478 [Streptococcus sp. ACC21]|nr:hypothetical protein HMPREF1510_1478 [Streptococcus sp. ACC21]EWC99280.1 hypothetical protein HMPREF1509_1443 [Streptococcus sp. AC15]
MVPKPSPIAFLIECCFRAVLFRMVPKPQLNSSILSLRFRAVLFRMVPKLIWKS